MYFVNLAMGVGPFKLSSRFLSPTIVAEFVDVDRNGHGRHVPQVSNTCTSGLRGSDRLSPALCNIVPTLPALIIRLPSVSEVLLSEESPKGEVVAGSVMTWPDVHFPLLLGASGQHRILRHPQTMSGDLNQGAWVDSHQRRLHVLAAQS
jgi:hypothetical protein